MSRFPIVATLNIEPGRREAYLKHLRAHAERCRSTEPGTLQFDILIPRDDPDSVLLYELYSSAEAFEAHLKGPSFKQATADTRDIKVTAKGTHCDVVD